MENDCGKIERIDRQQAKVHVDHCRNSPIESRTVHKSRQVLAWGHKDPRKHWLKDKTITIRYRLYVLRYTLYLSHTSQNESELSFGGLEVERWSKKEIVPFFYVVNRLTSFIWHHLLTLFECAFYQPTLI